MRATAINLTSTNGNQIPNQIRIDVFNEGQHTIIFQSYYSTILTVDTENTIIKVGADFNYSRTTNKYCKQFLKEVLNDGFADIMYKAMQQHIEQLEMWRIIYE